MKRKIDGLCWALSFFWIFALVVQAQQTTAASSSVPRLIRYSGVAADPQGKHPSGTVGATFALYKDEQGGAALWVETQNVIADSSGRYTVQLGAGKPEGLPAELFTSGEARWLGVSINGQAEQLRVLLLSVPYALKAADAETVGGLPPSAFVLAVPPNSNPSNNSSGSNSNSGSNPNPPALGGSGKKNYLPIWTSGTNLGNSALFQSGKGAKAQVGIGTTTPASTLDVNGGGTVRGLFSLPATGTATASSGFDSQPMDLTASVFNSSTSTAVPQTFQWQTEPVGNNTSNATGSLNLLFAQGTGKPAETGLNIASNGQINFATGQTFPGTITGVTAGAGLSGGGNSGNVSLSVPSNGITNSMLQNSALTVNPGGGMTGGGKISLGGSAALGLQSCGANQILEFVSSAWTCTNPAVGTITGVTAGTDLTGGGSSGNVTLNVDTTKVVTGVVAGTDLTGGGTGGVQTLNLDTTKVPQLNAANTFTGNQTVSGNLSATGVVTGSAFNIGSNLFAFGSFANSNAFMGFAGNSTMSGFSNTATGVAALSADTSGHDNTASGYAALAFNSGGLGNSAVGSEALLSNTSGGDNEASGAAALHSNTTGDYNTADGAFALGLNTTASENTAVGFGALQSNLGSNNTAVGVNAGEPTNYQNTTGANNTFVGSNSNPGTQLNLNNATAVGANSQVTASNSLVLGSINGVNGATADTTVGIGTTTPVPSGLPDGSTTTLNVVGNNTYVPLVVQSPSTFGTWMLLNNTSTGGKNWAILSAASGDGEGAGNLGITNFTGTSTIYLEGNVVVGGNLSKGGGSFKIDHPLDPANKYLYHSFVESPDMMDVYNGNVITSKQGLATVVLPNYFEALNRDFRYQLTVIGQFAQAMVAKEISRNRFTIKTNKPGVKVSWQVTGIRHDAYANAHRIPVEEDKLPQEQGHYLHPELFGASSDWAIGLRSPVKGAATAAVRVASASPAD
jgi:hypothetical protein